MVMSRFRLRGFALVLALAGVVGIPGVAWAEDGQWWYSTFQIAEAHQAGATGAGVTVAVIDGGINPDLPMFAGQNLTVREPSYCVDTETGDFFPATWDEPNYSAWHGTNVTGLIIGNGQGVSGVAPEVDLHFYAIGADSSMARVDLQCGGDSVSKAIVEAVKDGAQIISYSGGGGMTPSYRAAVAWAQNQGVIVVAALANEATESEETSVLNGVVAISSVDSSGAAVPPAHARVTAMAPGSDIALQGNPESHDWNVQVNGTGTSFATPIVVGMLAVVWSKYPDATGNQLIQSLIRNTGVDDHDLAYDPTAGYGIASLTHMLAHDPTQYPDVNPLVVDDPAFDGDLSAADIAGAVPPGSGAETSSPDSEITSDADVKNSENVSESLPLTVWVGVGVLLLGGVVITAVVMLVKRRQSVSSGNGGVR